jgi:hypothetical protein
MAAAHGTSCKVCFFMMNRQDRIMAMWVVSQLRELALPACMAAPVAEFVVISLAPQLDALSTAVEVRAIVQSHTLP